MLSTHRSCHHRRPNSNVGQRARSASPRDGRPSLPPTAPPPPPSLRPLNRAPTRCRPGRGAASAQREPTRRTPVVASHRRRTTIRCRRRVVEGMRTGTALRRRWDGADIDSAAAQHRTCGCGRGRDDDACVRIRDARGAPRSFLPPSLLRLLPLLSPPSSSPIVRIVIFTSPPLGRGGGRVPPRQTIFLSS